MKHVLTVLVFWSWVLMAPHLPSFIQEPQIVPLNWHLLSWPLRANSRICSRSSPATRAKTGRTAQVFAIQAGTHRKKGKQSHRNSKDCSSRVRLFWYRDVFFVVSRWPKSPFRYRDLCFGIEILYSVVQHLYRPLLGINLSVLFCASTSCKLEVKEDLDTEKKIEYLDT